MPSPKSGTACTADLPEAPVNADDASVADPGQQVSKKEIQSEQGSNQQQAGQEEKNEEEKSHWIGIELKDDDDNPVPGEEYLVKLPDGATKSGRLDDQGKAKVEGIPEGGTAEVTFPRIHENDVSQQ